ncbi:MAG: hypothetical protein V1804_01270 [Patescibacteria group bacterium]
MEETQKELTEKEIGSLAKGLVSIFSELRANGVFSENIFTKDLAERVASLGDEDIESIRKEIRNQSPKLGANLIAIVEKAVRDMRRSWKIQSELLSFSGTEEKKRETMGWKVSIEGVTGIFFTIPVLQWATGKITLRAQPFMEVMLLEIGDGRPFPIGLYSEISLRGIIKYYGLKEPPLIDEAWKIIRKSKGKSPSKENCEELKRQWEKLLQKRNQ